MKIAALILGILGSLAAAGLGASWLTQYKENYPGVSKILAELKEGGADMSELDAKMAELENAKNAGYLLFGGSALSFIASLAVFSNKLRKFSGGVMLAVALVPAALAPKSLVFTFFLIIAGALALAAKPKATPQPELAAPGTG